MNKPNWTPIKIRLGDIRAWEANPRMSTKAQANRIIESERKFNQVIPFIISPSNTLLDGHQRLAAWLTVYGEDHVMDAMQADRELSDAEHKELVITLHTGATGSWDWNIFANGWATVQELDGWGMGKETLKGWNNDASNLKELLASEKPAKDAPADIDRAAELLEKWGVVTGDLWQIGEHRLICGDCTDAATVARVMGGERAELAPVDPPYNVGFEYDGETVDDEKTEEKYKEFTLAWFAVCQSVSDKQIITPSFAKVWEFLTYIGAPKHQAAWIKTNAMTHGIISRYACFEPVLFYGDGFGKKRTNDVFDYPVSNQQGVGDHPCPKPLKMWIDLIENYSEGGSVVYDAFGGSGTTMMASENTGRKARVIEISPEYCALQLERMAMAFPELEIRRV